LARTFTSTRSFAEATACLYPGMGLPWQREWYQVFRFARPKDADRFIKELGGERMHPSEKGKGKNWAQMAQRHPQTMIVRWAAAGLVLLFSCGIALPDDMTGQASIIDGDTLEIHGTRIRLWGIDAPESSQLCRGEDSEQYRCGAQVANDLDAFIARRPVSCLPISLDRYGRTVATCSVGGADLGQWLVRNGLALDWPQYSKAKYAADQRDAEQAGRGIWRGSYVEPWLYRVCIRANGSPAKCSDDANGHP
jgi:endonuclease YncB( thermonuclease family)